MNRVDIGRGVRDGSSIAGKVKKGGGGEGKAKGQIVRISLGCNGCINVYTLMAWCTWFNTNTARGKICPGTQNNSILWPTALILLFLFFAAFLFRSHSFSGSFHSHSVWNRASARAV